MSLGLALGLVLAEAAFHHRDDGAFPHVNFYEADAELGTRLRPHAEEQISFSGNPVSTARTNALGFRGADWATPPSGTREVLVVGDSQVFGLGVEEGQTFSAVLAQKLGRPVLNAGVPTYGPPEYLAVARRLIESRPSIDTLVLGLNMANDVFEASQPNRDRHAVWDGWAVRVETAPRTAPTPFPGRAWLMARSHLVFALRALWNSSGRAHEPEGGFPSEGVYGALVSEAGAVETQQATTAARTASIARRLEARQDAASALRELNEAVFDQVVQHHDEATVAVLKSLAKFEGDPRDILESRNAESARRIDYTAQALLYAALSMRKTEAALRAVPALAGDRELKEILQARTAAEERLRAAEAAAGGADTASTTTSLAGVIRAAQRLCDAHGVTLVVLVLPLDVQVSSSEWAKYGLPVTDVSATRALNADAVVQAARVGARAVDPLPALAMTPGAFLHGDLHLTPAGHRVVADAIADIMARPPAPPPPTSPLELPPGRSFIPSHESWRLAPEVTVRGSSKAECETKLIREWFRMICKSTPEHRPIGIERMSGGGGEALAFVVPRPQFDGLVQVRDVGLLVPLLPGQRFEADVVWTHGRQRLVLEGPSDMAFVGPLMLEKRALTERETLVRVTLESEDLYGLDPLCDEQRSYDECALGGIPRARTCPADHFAFGVLGRCVPTCGGDRPACAAGLTCRAWQGVQGCVP